MRYYFMSAAIMAAAILFAVVLQPLVTAVWPSVDSIAIGGFGAGSYIPLVSSMIFTLLAAFWLSHTWGGRLTLRPVLLVPVLWSALVVYMLLSSAGHLTINRFSVFMLLYGLLPIASTSVGWMAAVPSRKMESFRNGL